MKVGKKRIIISALVLALVITTAAFEGSAKVPDARRQENFDRSVLSGTRGSKFSDNAVDATFAEPFFSYNSTTLKGFLKLSQVEKLQNQNSNQSPFSPQQIPKIKPIEIPKINKIIPKPESCSKKEYKMAFILLVQNPEEATQARIDMINRIKTNFSQSFKYATDSLAKIDTSANVFTLQVTDEMFDEEDPSFMLTEKISEAFYENHNDDYDFLTIYNTFEPIGGLSQLHTPVKNTIIGIGLNIYDNTELYGSPGKLLGINNMRNIDMYIPVEDLAPSGILHETGHQWCCWTGDPFANGENNALLEIRTASGHYYNGLTTPNEGSDPLNANFWTMNENGSYDRFYGSNEALKYHPFTLYFMGVLPKNRYGEEYTIVNAGPDGGLEGENAEFYSQVSVNDIIAAMGSRSCAK